MTRRRVAIVVQRYGESVTGGAELLARWLAEHMQESLADVEVLTTCAMEFTTWANFFPEGVSELNGVVVRRFLVDKERDWEGAKAATWTMLNSDRRTIVEEQRWIEALGPVSSGLLRYIEKHRDQYDCFIFSTYLYATTYYGLQLVPEKAILVPNAHDEPYLYLSAYRPLFHLPKALVYNTETERETVARVTDNRPHTVSIVTGVGIDMPDELASAVRFREKFQIADPFMLYVGRLAKAKNIPELVAHFIRYKQQYGGELKLVLAGKGDVEVVSHPDVIPIGFITEQEKFDALAAAEMGVMPSLYESLSMIALETWLLERPMVVNGRCLVLKNQCKLSGGGLYYHSYEEFAMVVNRLRRDEGLRDELGQSGKQFVIGRYHWDIIMAKYQALFEALAF